MIKTKIIRVHAAFWDGTEGTAAEIISWISQTGGLARYRPQTYATGSGVTPGYIDVLWSNNHQEPLYANEWVIEGFGNHFYKITDEEFIKYYKVN